MYLSDANRPDVVNFWTKHLASIMVFSLVASDGKASSASVSQARCQINMKVYTVCPSWQIR
jgi:hypothetical protein